MIIKLKGYSPDREIQVVEALLSEHHMPIVEGQFTIDGFVTVNDVSQEIQDIISNYFAPGKPIIRKTEMQELKEQLDSTSKMVDTLLMGEML